MERFNVYIGARVVGVAQVFADGLYCIIKCTCQQQKGLHRLFAKTPSGLLCIGVCAPVGERIGIERRISAKSLGKDFTFLLVGDTASKGAFHLIKPDAPFDALHKLESARFAVIDGQAGLIIEDQESGCVGI